MQPAQWQEGRGEQSVEARWGAGLLGRLGRVGGPSLCIKVQGEDTHGSIDCWAQFKAHRAHCNIQECLQSEFCILQTVMTNLSDFRNQIKVVTKQGKCSYVSSFRMEAMLFRTGERCIWVRGMQQSSSSQAEAAVFLTLDDTALSFHNHHICQNVYTVAISAACLGASAVLHHVYSDTSIRRGRHRPP